MLVSFCIQKTTLFNPGWKRHTDPLHEMKFTKEEGAAAFYPSLGWFTLVLMSLLMTHFIQ